MFFRRTRRRVQAEELLALGGSAGPGGAANRAQSLSLNLLRPAKVFLWCACCAECVLIVPNLAAELHLADDGPHVAICRICLFLARMSLIVAPALARLLARCSFCSRRRVTSLAAIICGTACGSVEPSRGIATALAGWYLISTPMHDAFGTQSEAGQESESSVLRSTGLLVPCAMIMAANVCLFLCDALMLTVAPLLRQQSDGGSPRAPPTRHWSTPEVILFGMEDEHSKDKEYEATCVICLSDFENGESVARLPCRHMFHTACVNEWLAAHGTCPMRCLGYVLPPRPRPVPHGPARAAWELTGSPAQRAGARSPSPESAQASPWAAADRAPRLARWAPAVIVMASGDLDYALHEDDTSSHGSLATEELVHEAEATVEFPLPFAVPSESTAPTTIGLPEGDLPEISSAADWESPRRSREVWRSDEVN